MLKPLRQIHEAFSSYKIYRNAVSQVAIVKKQYEYLGYVRPGGFRIYHSVAGNTHSSEVKADFLRIRRPLATKL